MTHSIFAKHRFYNMKLFELLDNVAVVFAIKVIANIEISRYPKPQLANS